MDFLSDVLRSFFPVLVIITLVLAIFVIFCTENKAKVFIRGIPSVVASSSIYVYVYGGSQNNQTTVPRGGGGSSDQRPIVNLNLTSSVFKAPASTRDVSKVVHGGSGGVARDLTTIVIDGTSGKVNTNVYSSNGSAANKCGHHKGYSVGVCVQGGGTAGCCANGASGGGNAGVGSRANADNVGGDDSDGSGAARAGKCDGHADAK